MPGCFGSSLSCPLSSEAGLGATVQPQGALAEVSQNAGGVGFWGAKSLWVTGALVPRGRGSGVGWSCCRWSDPVGPTEGSTASGGATGAEKGLPGVEKGGGEARPGSRLKVFLVQDSQHSRWKPGMEQ